MIHILIETLAFAAVLYMLGRLRRGTRKLHDYFWSERESVFRRLRVIESGTLTADDWIVGLDGRVHAIEKLIADAEKLRAKTPKGRATKK